MHGSRESITPTIQGSGDISTCVQDIPTTSFAVTSSAPISWGHSFGLQSYPTGLSGPVFSYLWNPHLTFPARVHDYYGCVYPGLGRPDGGFPDFWLWTRSDRKLHIKPLELKAVILSINHWISVLWGHQLMVAKDNTTAVAYINKQGGFPIPCYI